MPTEPPPELPPEALPPLRRSMSLNAGVERTGAGLNQLLGDIDALTSRHGEALPLVAARLVAQAALNREESRGGHWRADFPALAKAARRTFIAPANITLREPAE